MYEDCDVLAQVLEQARKDLGENAKGLPHEPPSAALWTFRRFWTKNLRSPELDFDFGAENCLDGPPIASMISSS